METLTWITLAVIALVLVAWYLTYSAARLDRLHAKVEGALAALDAQLVRRAEAALELGASGFLDPATSLLLVDVASTCLDRTAERDEDGHLRLVGLAERESAESDLTDALNAALTDQTLAELRMRGGAMAEELIDRIAAAGLRVQIARRFHNQAVTEVQRVRRKRVVRAFRLAGYAPLPETVEFNDELTFTG
ncbi:MAG: hypothetical protein GXY39_06395 [Actinomycetales bacterium]|nr:hypothetical protein [Tetrasphaera sp.]NLW99322.1 hypothetical protein [Actinomycetales bacterium]